MTDFDITNNVSVGEATKKEHWDQLLENTLALRQLSGKPAGGDWEFRQTDVSFTKIAAHVILPINGNDIESIDIEFMAKVDAGTGQIRFFNITDAVILGSAVNVTATSDTLGTITGLTPVVGAKNYRIEALKGTTWIKVWGVRVVLT